MNFATNARYYVGRDADGLHIIRVRPVKLGIEVTDIVDEALAIRHIVAPEHVEDYLSNFADLRIGDDAVRSAYKRLAKVLGPIQTLYGGQDELRM